MSGKMFEPLNKSPDSHIRIRKFALIIAIVSLLIFIGLGINHEIQAKKYEREVDGLFPYYPSDFESGLGLGSFLGIIIAILLFPLSFLMRWCSRK
jgi:hypothetical protein